jgi:hypothetical protein
MFRAVLLSAALVLSLVYTANAANINGKWKGKIEFNGESIDLVYDLKVEGNKLTGNVTGPAGTLDLEEGKVDGDKISFQISFGDFHIKHDGKLVDGKFEITSHLDQGDQKYTITRGPDLNGVWKGKAEFPGGQIMEVTYTLKLADGKLIGSVESPRGKIEMSDTRLTEDGFTFNTKREDVNVAHEAKWNDGKITIKVHTSAGDREYTLTRSAESKAANIAGAWQTTIKMDDGTELPLKYDYKIDGNKLTGTVEGPAGPLEIKEGKVDGDKISYKLTIMDNEVSYEGQAADGKINLKSRGGPFGDREYTLARPVSQIAGVWETKFKMDDGTEMPLKFDLKLDGEKLTGTVKSDQGDGAISGKVSGDDISFDVEFGGNTITHKGKLAGKEIKLKVNGFGSEWELTLSRPAAAK